MPYFKNRDDRELFYVVEGAKKNPILFLHGQLGSSLSHWSHQLENIILQKHFQLIAPDYRGFGKSNTHKSKWGEKFLASDLLNDIEDLISNSLMLTQAPIIVGYSMGAALALEYGKKYPVSGFILLSPRPFIFSKGRSLPFLSKEKRSESVLRAYFWGIIKKVTKQLSYRSLKQKLNQPELIEGFKKLKNIPTLIVYALNDSVTPRLAFKILKNNLPNAKVKEFPGDHGINHESPEKFNKVILDFCMKIKFTMRGL